jgi:hypothetical protein
MIDKEQIIEIIEFLEHVRESLPMYFKATNDIEAVTSFLLGFNIAYMLTTGKQVPRFDPEGWIASYYKVPFPHFDRNIEDIPPEDLIDQTLEVQINSWKKHLETLN